MFNTPSWKQPATTKENKNQVLPTEGGKKKIDFIFDLKCSVCLILNYVHLRTFIPIIVALC